MSEPPPFPCAHLKPNGDSWSLVDGRMQPLRSLRSGVSPTLPPAKAQELVQKQIDYKERRDLGSRATDITAPWTMHAQYAPSPQNVHGNLTPFTAVNTADSGETGMSQARFETPPPMLDEAQRLSSPTYEQSLDEIATSALQSDALLEATAPTGPFMTLAQISEEGEINTAIAEIVGKRKLLIEELQHVNTRIKTEVSMIVQTCAIELPRIKEAVKMAITFSGFSQCVCSLIVSYAPRALPHTYAPCRAVGRDPQGSRGDAPT